MSKLVNRRIPNGPHGGVEGGLITRPSDSALYLSVIGLILFIGVTCWKTNKIGGLIIITIGSVIFIMAAVKFRKMYLDKTR